MASEVTATDDQGPARAHRRRHVRLQEGADRVDGDIEKAIEYLRKKGLATAAKKAGRIADRGRGRSVHPHGARRRARRGQLRDRLRRAQPTTSSVHQGRRHAHRGAQPAVRLAARRCPAAVEKERGNRASSRPRARASPRRSGEDRRRPDRQVDEGGLPARSDLGEGSRRRRHPRAPARARRQDRREHQDPPLRALRARRGPGEEIGRLRRRGREAGRPGLDRETMAKGKGKSPPGHNGDVNGAPATSRRRPPARPRASASGATESDSKLPLAPGVKYRRILLKLSGEALMGDASTASIRRPSRRSPTRSPTCHGLGVEIAIVIGGGNIFRGVAASASGMDRASADYMGMLATVINALALQDALEKPRRRTPACMTAHRDAAARRALHPPARGAPPREGPVVIFARRHRQPLLHHRHRRRRCARWRSAPSVHEGHQGRRRLRQGPEEGPGRRAVHGALVPRSAQAEPQGDGLDRHLAVHGQRPADHRLRPDRRREHPARRAGRADRHASVLDERASRAAA